jgi:hypothetical protein
MSISRTDPYLDPSSKAGLHSWLPHTPLPSLPTYRPGGCSIQRQIERERCSDQQTGTTVLWSASGAAHWANLPEPHPTARPFARHGPGEVIDDPRSIQTAQAIHEKLVLIHSARANSSRATEVAVQLGSASGIQGLYGETVGVGVGLSG